MARVKTSGLLNELIGSVGGSTFQRSRSGLILKNKPRGSHGNTVRRSVETNIMHKVLTSWQGLTEGQHALWKNYSNFKTIPQNNNPNLFLNGQQIFIKYNFYRLLTGRSLITTPVFGYTTLSRIDVTLTYSDPNLFITGDRLFDDTVEFIVIYITFPLSLGISNPGSRYRYIPITYASGGSIIITSDYISVFGRTPIAGEKVFFKYRLIDLNGYYILPWQYSNVIFS